MIEIELKQLETDIKLEEVFNYIATNTEVKQNIFLNVKYKKLEVAKWI